jgi:hypothetical protein
MRAEGRADVGVLAVAPFQPLALVGAGEVGFGGHGEAEEVHGVPLADLLQVTLGGQLLPAELADGLRHGEPDLAGGLGPAARWAWRWGGTGRPLQ